MKTLQYPHLELLISEIEQLGRSYSWELARHQLLQSQRGTRGRSSRTSLGTSKSIRDLLEAAPETYPLVVRSMERLLRHLCSKSSLHSPYE